jgi:FkbM family methyltransferase
MYLNGVTMKLFYKCLWLLACFLGKPIGGLRPRRIYHWLASRVFTEPVFRWHRNRWGDDLYLSPFYHIDRSIIAFGTYDPDLHGFIQEYIHAGMVCLDVGANIGEITLHMARCVGPRGSVIAFEPAPPLLERLKRHITKSPYQKNIIVEPIALSNITGNMKFFYANFDKENQGMGSLVSQNNDVVTRIADIEVKKLDDYVAENKIDRIDFIKVDIQGAEPLFLDGASKTIHRFQPDILMEVSPSDLVSIGSNSQDIVHRIEDFGYRVFEIAGGKPKRQITHTTTSEQQWFSNVLCTTKLPSTFT